MLSNADIQLTDKTAFPILRSAKRKLFAKSNKMTFKTIVEKIVEHIKIIVSFLWFHHVFKNLIT